MKTTLLKIFIVCGLLSSCVAPTTVYQLTTNCDKITCEELFSRISTLLVREGFLIKQSDTGIGYLQAESTPTYGAWSGTTETYYWIFKESHGKIIAIAKKVAIEQNELGATRNVTETYFDDETDGDYTWYWTVRKGLEKICGEKIVIREFDKN